MTTVLLILVGAGIAVLQSTWLSGFMIAGARPDLVLLVLTYSAYRSGVQRGQIVGFVTGLIEDGVSVSPPGFHAVVRLVHCVVAGSTRGSITNDAIVTPVSLATVAFLAKTIAVLVFGSVLQLEQVTTRVFTVATLLEGLMTILIAPPVFWLLRKGFDQRMRGS